MSTIDYGIDLGTTNSAVAVLRGVDTEVIKNNDDQQTTPSAVWIDKRDRLFVGRAARERAELDPDNTSLEFKLRMGTSDPIRRFATSGREMTAEQLSAEVLKSLRGDVRQRDGVELDAAVITVPAAFDLSACDATRRAGALAGLVSTPLIQEPTAAAFAYGFQSEQDARWLVYDLGGGTFDAAVVQVRDGEFTVLNHRGDNFLGGKLIDWQIVETLLIPAVAAEFGVDDLRRGNARWSVVINKLKLAAEAAKVRLSRVDSTDVVLDLDLDGAGRVEFEYELARADVERLTEPFLVRSINLCRQALSEANLGSDDIGSVLLVGGPTLSPYLRERLADPGAGLGIGIDHSQDPLTVVARGAAIFAGTQERPATADAAPVGAFSLQLEYPPVGPDLEPLIVGRLNARGAAEQPDLTGYMVEFVNADAQPAWRSGLIPVASDGIFSASVVAQPRRRNLFRIELTDATGASRQVAPDSFPYTVGIVETSPLLTASIGVGLDGNSAQWLLFRGSPLPGYGRARLRTTVDLRVGRRGGIIRIPLVEGEHARADRNRRIGQLEVIADQVDRDVPAGSEVEVRIDVDASRLIVARAYVPLLDEEFEHVVSLNTEAAPTHDALADGVSRERTRLAAVRGRQAETQSAAAEMMLFRIDNEKIEPELIALLDAAQGDPDATTACSKRLLDLRAAVDAVEDALEWPEQVAVAEDVIAGVAAMAGRDGNAHERRRVTETVELARGAIETENSRTLAMHVEELRTVAGHIMSRTGELDLLIFEDLERRSGEYTDRAGAEALIARGRAARAQGDDSTLNDVNLRLRGMLPTPPPPPDPFSTVRRA